MSFAQIIPVIEYNNKNYYLHVKTKDWVRYPISCLFNESLTEIESIIDSITEQINKNYDYIFDGTKIKKGLISTKLIKYKYI